MANSLAAVANQVMSIGDLAERTGLAVSAIRFYETKGLVTPARNKGGQRRYLRSDIRRLSFVQIAQQLGFSIEEIRAALATLPQGRTPTQKDWEKISRNFHDTLEERIQRMTRLQSYLAGCIGCGCLSMKKCALVNPEDGLKRFGPGPRAVLGDRLGK
jgi:MerR family transcriptional regulator, redox-sensitive transcriptional activator SoxR